MNVLLEKDGVDPDSRDKGGRTPLSRAMEKGRPEAVQLLECALRKHISA